MTFRWLDRLPTKSLVNSESRRGYVTWFAMFLKTYNFFHIKCHSKNNGPVLFFNTALYLGTETVSCRPLERIARMDVDWNLKKMEVLMLCLSKISKNILMLTTPNWNCLSMGKGTERERHLTTARANQTTGLTNSRARNWEPEVEFSPFRALSRRQMTFPFCCQIKVQRRS